MGAKSERILASPLFPEELDSMRTSIYEKTIRRLFSILLRGERDSQQKQLAQKTSPELLKMRRKKK